MSYANQAQRTPIPWEVFDTLDSEDDDVAPVIEIRHLENSTRWHYIGSVNDIPDAEFIVRACNSHDALIAALRECKIQLHRLGAGGANKAMLMLNAALDAAGDNK